MTIEQIATRAAAITAELETLDGESDWTAEQRGQFDALTTELADLEQRKADIETRASILARASNLANVEAPEAPTIHVRKTDHDAFDLRTLSFAAGEGELRARALTAIEKMPEVPDRVRQQAAKIVERTPKAVAERVLLTGSEAYRSAYRKGLAGQGALWTQEEATAFRAALSLTDANGGYAVPFLLDPTIISTNDVSTNPFRRIGRVVTGTSDVWNGLTSAGVTASFDAEGAEVSDDSPTLGQPAITAYKGAAFVRGSIEVASDWGSIEADLRAMFQEAKDDLEGTQFATGSGTAPQGIVTALTGTASEINAAADDTFAIGDVYTVEAALPPKYRLAVLDGDTQTSRASWVANHAIYNKIRQFDTTGGASLWETLGGGLPPRLLGYPAYEASAMDGTITTAGAVSNFILVIGDFRNYVIYDRVGMSVEFIPHLFHTANNLPSGQRGWYAYWRVGADSVNDDAFRMLDVASAA